MKPPVLCKLVKGTLIDVNEGFVDTFNWLVDFCNNLKGDGEVDFGRPLWIDRRKDDRPVIRFSGRLAAGGGGGGAVSVSADGPFSPIYDDEGDDPDVVTGFANCYWQYGGKTVLLANQSMPGANGFIALRAGATPETAGDAALNCYATLAALQAAQNELEYFTVPIYRVASSKIVLDLRRMPHVEVAEVLP